MASSLHEFSLRVDVQIYIELLLGVERTEGLGRALLPFQVGPYFVLDIGRQLSEAVAAVLGGNEAFDVVGLQIFEIDNGAGERFAVGTENFSLNRSLYGALLRKSVGAQNETENSQRSYEATPAQS